MKLGAGAWRLVGMAGAEADPVAPADAPEQVRQQLKILGLAKQPVILCCNKGTPQPEEM
jgi:hypothetical protein